MLISDFDFDLPEELIAQTPLERRESSRMLIVNRGEKTFADNNFYNFPLSKKRRRFGSQQHKSFPGAAVRSNRNRRENRAFSRSKH